MLKNPFRTTNLLVKKYQNLINQINVLENNLKALSDSELRNQSFQLIKCYEQNKNLDLPAYSTHSRL